MSGFGITDTKNNAINYFEKNQGVKKEAKPAIDLNLNGQNRQAEILPFYPHKEGNVKPDILPGKGFELKDVKEKEEVKNINMEDILSKLKEIIGKQNKKESEKEVKIPEGLTPDKIIPGLQVKFPAGVDSISKKPAGEITSMKAPETRAKNGLNLADANKIMRYIEQRHDTGSSYDLTNLSPAEAELYKKASIAVAELNPHNFIYDISDLDTSVADELIKKFEQENS